MLATRTSQGSSSLVVSLFTVEEVIAITGARPRGACERSAGIDGVSTDSRGVARGDLFVALRGAFFNGVEYVRAALDAGAAVALVPVGVDVGVPPDRLLDVDDPLRAVRALATARRERFRSDRLRVIGITGSNGKTAVKDMLCSIVAAAGITLHATSGSRNSQLGVALTLLDLKPEHRVAIVETGINRPGDMERLAAMVRPDLGVITLIGEAHAEFLGGGERTAREKARLFEAIPAEGVVALNADDRQTALLASLVPCRTVRFGLSAGADVRALDVRPDDGGYRFRLKSRSAGAVDVRLSSVGEHAVLNALAAAAVAVEGLGLPLDPVARGLGRYVPAPMRLELSETDDGVTLLNDAYVADPVSMRRALLALAEIAGPRRKIAVLGTMLELGDLAVPAHRAMGAVVHDTGVDLLITVGDLARQIADTSMERGAPPRAVFQCATAADAAERLAELVRSGDVVLLKGSRALKLERVARRYLSSLRPTVLGIDLDAVEANARTIRTLVGPNVAVCGVIKSHGYGLDSRRIADVLLANGVDSLAVAIPDEGARLRRAGVKAPILAFGSTLPEEADKVVANDLTQVLSTLALARALAEEAEARGRTAKVHIKVDTGMGRLGIRPEEVLAFAREIARLPRLDIEGVMTHFPAADDPAEDGFTRRQIRDFVAVGDELRAAGFDIRTRHAANSIGLLRFPEARLDMVRPGLALYGLWCTCQAPDGAPKLQPVASLITKIAYLKKVRPGTSISYSRTFLTARESVIATLPLGYVDGLFRSLSNRGLALVRGQLVPIVGLVCMDQTMIDVTDVPGVEVGDEVVLFGRQGDAELPLSRVAELAGTIPYEVLARIDARVPRVHSRRG
jgi:alanine racemase